jgi:16S rRNA (cytidine1402-2'-O)-methyltransferase
VSGKLYVVATPIGNIKDITLRALEVLKNVGLIACEDTRHSSVLLEAYSIGTPTTSYHKFNIHSKTDNIIDQILSGKDVALISDAGTPGISDPGEELIRSAINAGIVVEAVPGPSAAVAALSISGIRTDKFIFEGFLSQKHGERKLRIEELSSEPRTIIFYEAPHRILETLTDMLDILGDRPISIARELTKKFEEVNRGTISEIMQKYSKKTPKGEFVIILKGKDKDKGLEVKEEYVKLMKELGKAGLPKSDSAKIVSKVFSIPKNELYRLTLGS